jgi:hypothetical protein
MLKNHSLAPAAPKVVIDPLEGMSDADMIALRQKIDLKLKTDLSRLDLAEELGMQYRAAMVLLDSIQNDKDVPANQRAQVYNSVRSSLGEIIKQQKIVYSAERLKRFEAAFLKVLQQLPSEQTRVFFDLYGEFLAQDSEAAKAHVE